MDTLNFIRIEIVNKKVRPYTYDKVKEIYDQLQTEPVHSEVVRLHDELRVIFNTPKALLLEQYDEDTFIIRVSDRVSDGVTRTIPVSDFDLGVGNIVGIKE